MIHTTMRNFIFVIIVFVAISLTSCADSISDIERTYQQGIERAEKAQSVEELSQITIDVRNELINGAKGFGGDRKLNDEEMRRYRNAQHSFEQAIESRNYQLTGSRGVWRDSN